MTSSQSIGASVNFKIGARMYRVSQDATLVESRTGTGWVENDEQDVRRAAVVALTAHNETMVLAEKLEALS